MYEIVFLIKEEEKTTLYKIISHFTENKFGFQNKK